MNLTKPQFFLIFLPFIFINDIYEHPWMLIIPIIIYLVDIKSIKFFSLKYFKEAVSFILILVLFLQIFYDDTHLFIHELRFREFTLIFILIELFVFVSLIKLKDFTFLNIFFLIFSITQLITGLIPEKKFVRDSFLEKLEYSFDTTKEINEKSNAPVVLIVLDEYSASEEIFKMTKDSVDFKLEEYLDKKNYTIKSNFKTKSLRTSISLPSIFNFNFHNNIINDSIENVDKGLQIIPDFGKLVRDNLLVDSLNIKNINSYSYGMFPFKNGINSEDFYYYWENKHPNKNLLSIFFRKTVIWSIIKNINRESTTFDLFRKSALDKFEEIIFEKKSFYYFHLYFPHDPFTYYDEYPSKDLNYLLLSEDQYLDEHIKYKRWFQEKLISILDKKLDENTRIIIVGDHGFRYNSKVDPAMTIGAFKNYSKNSLKQINSVQDVGYLINSSF